VPPPPPLSPPSFSLLSLMPGSGAGADVAAVGAPGGERAEAFGCRASFLELACLCLDARPEGRPSAAECVEWLAFLEADMHAGGAGGGVGEALPRLAPHRAIRAAAVLRRAVRRWADHRPGTGLDLQAAELTASPSLGKDSFLGKTPPFEKAPPRKRSARSSCLAPERLADSDSNAHAAADHSLHSSPRALAVAVAAALPVARLIAHSRIGEDRGPAELCIPADWCQVC